ncbi:MAG: ankyrin repeat domain-containing protein [Syntrophorhabdales bacterium]
MRRIAEAKAAIETLDPQDVNFSVGGVTPLYAACECGHLDIVRLLLSHGANPNQLNSEVSSMGSSPLNVACFKLNTHVIEPLLKVGADPDNDNFYYSCTPLTALVSKNPKRIPKGRPTLVKAAEMLLKAGADPSIINFEKHRNAFDYVTRRRIPGMMKLFEQYRREKLIYYKIEKAGYTVATKGMTTDADWPPLIMAMLKGDSKAFKAHLASVGADPDYAGPDGQDITAMQVGILYNKRAYVKALIEAGAKVKDDAISAKRGPLLLAIQENKLEITKMLLEKGAEVDEVNFLVALRIGRVGIIQALLKAGANVNFRHESDRTPLYLFLSWRSNRKTIPVKDVKVVELLLQHGADPTIETGEGNSAIELAHKLPGCHNVMELFKKYCPEKVVDYWAGKPVKAAT